MPDDDSSPLPLEMIGQAGQVCVDGVCAMPTGPDQTDGIVSVDTAPHSRRPPADRSTSPETGAHPAS